MPLVLSRIWLLRVKALNVSYKHRTNAMVAQQSLSEYATPKRPSLEGLPGVRLEREERKRAHAERFGFEWPIPRPVIGPGRKSHQWHYERAIYQALQACVWDVVSPLESKEAPKGWSPGLAILQPQEPLVATPLDIAAPCSSGACSEQDMGLPRQAGDSYP